MWLWVAVVRYCDCLGRDKSLDLADFRCRFEYHGLKFCPMYTVNLGSVGKIFSIAHLNILPYSFAELFVFWGTLL